MPRGSEPFALRYRMLGINDEQTVCDHCGKADLKCTVALAVLDADGGELGIVRFGRVCAARALRRRARAGLADKIEMEARGVEWARATAGLLNSAYKRIKIGGQTTYPITIEAAQLPDGRIAVRSGNMISNRLDEINASQGWNLRAMSRTTALGPRRG